MQDDNSSFSTLTVGLGHGDNGNLGVVLMFTGETSIEAMNGGRYPGVVMSPSRAREIAFLILIQVEKLAQATLPSQTENPVSGLVEVPLEA